MPGRTVRTALLSRHISSFFHRNTTASQPREVLWSPIKQFTIPDTQHFYQQFAGKFDKSALLSQFNHSSISERVHRRCALGSFVEVRKSGTVDAGVVIQPQTNLFSKKTLSMINTQGEIIEFEPSDVYFHLAGLFKESVCETPSVIAQFISCSMEAKRQHQHLVATVQAWYTKESSTVDLDLMNTLELVARYSKRHAIPECLLYALHMHFSCNPLEFRVESGASKPVLQSMTGDSVPVTHYFANSINLIEDLTHAIELDDRTIAECNVVLQDLHDYSGEHDDLNVVISLLRYYKLYPHPQLTAAVSRLSKNSTAAQVLESIGSSCVLSPLEAFADIPTIGLKDHFNHLRFTNTDTVYLLPSSRLDKRGLHNLSDLGFSLRKSSDHWLLNIYIPDVASQISQASKQMNGLLNRVSDIDLTGQIERLLSDENIQNLAFQEDRECYALTISIKYPMGTDRPWYKTTSSVRLERLVNMKYIPLNDLNELWRSRFPLLSDLFSMFMSNEYTALQSQDRNLLLNVINMVDYWCLKRGQKCSMDQYFPRRDFSETAETSQRNFIDYFTSELHKIASHHVLQFSTKHNIPLLIHNQEDLPPLKDTFHVQSRNLVIPSYEAHDYSELTFIKDSSGMTPLANYFAAISLLSPTKVGTTSSGFASMGLSEGYTDVCNTLYDMESVVNHRQLISGLQSSFIKSQLDYKIGADTIFIKGFRMLSEDELQAYYNLNIGPAKRAHRDLEERAYRDAVTRTLHSENEPWAVYKCVAVKSATYPQTARAYCSEMGLEVDVLLSTELSEVKCGDQLICNRVVAPELVLRV